MSFTCVKNNLADAMKKNPPDSCHDSELEPGHAPIVPLPSHGSEGMSPSRLHVVLALGPWLDCHTAPQLYTVLC